jgi:hypothetical protein
MGEERKNNSEEEKPWCWSYYGYDWCLFCGLREECLRATVERLTGRKIVTH